MDRAEPMTDPITICGLSQEDRHTTRSLSVSAGASPVQTTSGTHGHASPFLQYKLSPDFDKLEEELRAFEGLRENVSCDLRRRDS